MSLSGLFHIGRSGLLASQSALTIVNNNIANVNTPGYSRQEIILELTSPVRNGGMLVGTGVTVAGIRRHYDQFIQTQILGQNQNQGRALSLDKAYGEIEQVFNEAQNLGMSKSMSDFFNAWQEIATNPEGQPQRTMLLQKASSLVRSAQSVERGMTDTLKHINEEIDSITTQINDLASQLAKLNDAIIRAEAGQQSATAIDLRAQRDVVLNDLGNLVDMTSYENSDGSITVSIGMQNLVSGINTNPFEKRLQSDGAYDFYQNGINITSNISKGKLGGFISAQQDITANPLTDFRKFIASVIKEVNLFHQSGFGMDGSTGNDFFNDLQITTRDSSAGADVTSASIANLSQVTLDEYYITFDAGSNYTVTNAQSGATVTSGAYVSGNPISFDGIDMTINGAVTANDSFFVSPLTEAVRNFGVSVTDYRQIAAASSAAGVPGDGSNANAIGQLTEAGISDLGDSFNNFYRTIVAYTGSAAATASDGLTFENNLSSTLNSRRDAVSGVNLDEEAINLVKFQRSYEAGARLIRVADELMQTILQL
jgi:flagellar hook-associated protein 1